MSATGRTGNIFAAAVIAASLAGCGQSSSTNASRPPIGASSVASPNVPAMTDAQRTAVLQRAAAMSTGLPLKEDAVKTNLAQMADGSWSAEGFINDLLDRPGVDDQLARLVFKGAYLGESAVTGYNYVLQKLPEKRKDGNEAFYVGKPCKADKTVAVAPWWDLQSKLYVCPDTHRPKVDVVSVEMGLGKWKKTQEVHCSSMFGFKNDICGCGENLLRCYKNFDHLVGVNKSILDELRHVVGRNFREQRPIKELFTVNETFRDRNAEFVYRRAQIMAGIEADLTDLKDWPETGKMAPRPELAKGQHAGGLTTSKVVYWNFGRRPRMRTLYTITTCSSAGALGASTEDVLSLESTGNLQITNQGWEKLAHKPICTGCHARLDYGMQFWYGYPAQHIKAQAFYPNLQRSGRGRTYYDDIDDLRGEGELNPRAWVELVTKQPEYSKCMVDNVASYILGPTRSVEQVKQLEGLFKEKPVFRPLMTRALSMYLARELSPPPAVESGILAQPSKAVASGTKISLPGPLHANLDDACSDCHNETPDFGAEEQEKRVLINALHKLSFREMPKWPTPMAEKDRREIIERLIAALWSSKDDRGTAANLLVPANQAPPVQFLSNALRLAHTLAGDPTEAAKWGTAEWGVETDVTRFTPNFGAVIGIEALRACKNQKFKGDDLRKCVDKATAFELYLR